MGGIIHSTRARRNLLASHDTAKLTRAAQNRLAAGKPVNSALESPFNVCTGSGLQARAGDLNALLEAISTGIKTLQAADNALTLIMATLQAMQSTLLEARLDKSCRSQTYSLSRVNLAPMRHLQFSGGSLGATPIQIALADNTGGATTPATAAQLAGGASSTMDFRANAAVTGGTNTLKTVDQIVNDINNSPLLKDRIIAANDGGKLRIENLSAKGLTVTGIDHNGNIDGSDGTSTIRGNKVRADLAIQFNMLRQELDETVRDSSFSGINLLAGDALMMFFNETGSSTLTIQATDPAGNPFAFNAANLGIPALAPSDLDHATAIDGYLDTLAQALNTARSEASNFASNLSIVQNRQDFTQAMINALKTESDDPTIADPNEEGANLMALQTRQQLSATALSLVALAAQALRRRFG